MADTSDAAVDAAAARASEQARLRRERREAKIRAGGTARLNKITGLGGGLQREPEPTVQPKVQPIAPASAQTPAPTANDPEEVDISVSEHFYNPSSSDTRQRSEFLRSQATPNPNRPYPGLGGDPTQIDDEMLKAMMLGMPPPSARQGNAGAGQQPMGNPFAGMPGMEGLGGFPGAEGGEDPMMAMLQQMMGAGGAGGAIPSFPGMPPMGMPGQAAPAQVDKYAYLWRIIHALFAISLGIYIALTVRFTGTKLAREESALVDYGYIKQFFWAGEALLLGRFLFKGQQAGAGESGVLGMILQFLPQPYVGYIRWALRYTAILRLVVADALLCVFALGVVGWWNKV